MSRQSDQVIDDDDVEVCPLCVEELDLSDRNFRPCPCGYQICQFCYNNIKTTLNGLCPACRRVYDDKNIQWKVISPEELASHKETVAQQAKKKAAARQKEAQKREADTLSRKHLAGIRVRQKNLVYITGMRPTKSAENLSETLRRDEYFGQYGEIIKVVVSKAKDTTNPHAPVGVYVTFADKDAAARCIQAVDGSQNYDTRLRAQYGTTKYCSAYLRGETCTNRGCMFLHEPGDANESFSRQDLSSMNVIATQSPTQANMSSSGQPPQPQPPPQQGPQSIAAAASPQHRRDSRDESASQADSTDSSALPISASWAHRNAPSRRASQHQSISSPSPLVSQATAITNALEPDASTAPKQSSADALSQESAKSGPTTESLQGLGHVRRVPSFISVLAQTVGSEDFHFVFDDASVTEEEKELFKHLPPLFDLNGAARRKLARKQEVEQTIRETDTQVASQALAAISTAEMDEAAGAGSLQLGGEPEAHPESTADLRQRQTAIRPPSLDNISSPVFGVEHTLSPMPNITSANNRNMSAQQQQYLLQQFKSASPAAGQSAASHQGHGRQASRYSFANDTSASANVKPAANPKLMSQQNSMMPSNQYNHQPSNQFFSSGVQGPPPGLKATGTPPVSGGGMFGQGHGFATAGLGYGVNATNRNANDEMMRELLRNRGGSAGSGQASDAGRREYMFSSSNQHSSQSSTPAPFPGLSSFPYGSQSGAFQDQGPQKQKKKGKKHRHANTSSSGGGVVDLADPSILQAQRLHQSSGQGHYGAQGQGQDIHGASTPQKSGRDDPFAGPAPFRGSQRSSPAGVGSRRSTPALPPGLPVPGARLNDELWSSDDALGATLPLMPELGRVPGTSPAGAASILNSPAVAESGRKERLESSVATTNLKTQQTAPYMEGKTLIRPDDESFPALPKARPSTASSQDSIRPKTSSSDIADKPKQNRISSMSTKPTTPAPIESQPKRSGLDNPKAALGQTAQKQEPQAQSSTSNVGRRQHPGKLDITAATVPETLPQTSTFVEQRSSTQPNSPNTSIRDAPSTPSVSSRAGTPASAEAGPKRVGQPRTLRVLATPKTETPPPQSASTEASGGPLAQIKSSSRESRQPSRQPSVASISISETPGTEKFPDNLSITTESISRTNSPPPGKVGSASVRAKSKSQQKKDRQERAKTASDDKAVADVEPAPTAEVVQEPLNFRKKKAKKPVTAPSIPKPTTSKRTPVAETPAKEVLPKVESLPERKHTPIVEKPFETSNEEKPQVPEKPKAEESRPSPDSTDAAKRQGALAASVLETLEASGELTPALLNFFKTTSLSTRHENLPADVSEVPIQPQLTPSELAQLDEGKPIRRNNDSADGDGTASTANRLLVTPHTRLCIRGLSRELEDRLLVLDDRVRTSRPPKKYTHNRNATAGYRAVDEILSSMTTALAWQPPAIDNETSVAAQANEQSRPEPKSPGYADDALSYLDQFILPQPTSRTQYGTNGNAGAGDSAGASPGADVDADAQAMGSAIPRTYTTGDPTYSVSGVDISNSPHAAAAGVRSSFGTEPVSASTTSPLSASHPSAKNSNLLAPLYEVPSLSSTAQSNDMATFNAQNARDAIAATLGAASNTLASVASAAAEAAVNAGNARGRRSTEATKATEAALASANAAMLNNVTALLAGRPIKTEEIKELARQLGLAETPAGASAGTLGSELPIIGTDAIRQALLASGMGGPKFLSTGLEPVGGKGVTREELSSGMLAELERQLQAAKRDFDMLEKRVAGSMRRNRKVAGL